MSDSNVIDFDLVRNKEIEAKKWKERMSYQPNKIKGTIDNILKALREAPEWQGVIRFNEFAARVEIHKEPPFINCPWDGKPVVWADHHDTLAQEWAHLNGISVNRETIGQAIMTAAQENGYHPVRDYLDGLKWDTKPRLENWLMTYAGADAEDSEKKRQYLQQVGAKWLISAVARVYEPGCKADHVLVLEGDQGIGKSSLLRILFDPWFTDCLPKLDSKDAAEATMGAWCIEIAEMAVWSKTDAEEGKAYISRQHERIRLPYGRHFTEWPRQCVFAGTINPTECGWLKDPTGNRRYWVVEAGKIDLEGIARDKDELFAEAVSRYKVGEPWHLIDASVIDTAKQEQAKRLQVDPWEDKIRDYTEGKPHVTIAELMGEQCLDISSSQQNSGTQKRMAAILRELGWIAPPKGGMKVNGKVVRRWTNPHLTRPLVD